MLAEVLHNDLQAPALHLESGSGRDPEELGEGRQGARGRSRTTGATVAFLAADRCGPRACRCLSAAHLTVVRATGPVRRQAHRRLGGSDAKSDPSA
jgi:4-diphosphocytidyl-2-C-methyl-D-erythritol kinase